MPLTSPTLETSPTLLTEAGEATPGGAVLPLGIRGIQVIIGARDLTQRCDSLTFSAVDRGGFEICTLGLPKDDRPPPGSRVVVRMGCSVAWEGRVAETSQHSIHSRGSKTLGAEGYQALLKDNPYSMVYVDRELGQWRAPSLARAIELVEGSYKQGNQQLATDEATPAIVQTIDDGWVAPFLPIVESWYDAGAGNRIAKVFVALGLKNWFSSLNIVRSWIDERTEGENSADLSAGGAGTSGTYVSFTTARRFASLLHDYGVTPGGQQSASFIAYWENVAAYGDHGLTGRGADPAGFFPSDIARHALTQAMGIDPGVIVDSIGYIAPHVVYREATDPAQVIDDMAKLLGWTWGVWGPTTMLGERPRLDFRPPPSAPTCAISKGECDEVDITLRLGDLYDTALVSYTDGAGTVGEATVRIPNAQLAEAGISQRTLRLSAGLSSRAAAETLGSFALALSQIASRGAGQATLPSHVRLANGASKPSMLLRPGIDRIRITDLSEAGSTLDYGNSRRDVFRISRVETQVTREGALNTRVELDNGSNLLETLQARLALAAGVVGAGASG